MKAYQFYVLLGKYKQRRLNAAEFHAFREAITKSRGFRHTFYESTGEQVPTHESVRQSGGSSNPKTREPQGSNSSRFSTTKINQPPRQKVRHKKPKTPVHGLSPMAEGSFQGTPLKVKRVYGGRHRSVKPRWFRVLGDLIKRNAITIGVGSFGIGFVLGFILPRSPNPDAFATHPQIEENEPEQLLSEYGLEDQALLHWTISDGKVSSEADQLMNLSDSWIDEKAPEQSTSNPPIIGLEAAIREGLEKRFPDPKKALSGLHTKRITAPQEEPSSQSL